MAILTEKELLELVTAAMLQAGVSLEGSRAVAEVTVQAQMRGVSSHGLQMIPVYIERIRQGGLDPKAEPLVERRGDCIWTVDGSGAPGQLAACRAVRLIQKALKEGRPGIVGIRNSNHCGMLAYYTEQITKVGGIGFMTTNTNPNVAAFGGAEKILGTNPFSIAFPTGGKSIVIDMATTSLAKGKLYEYAAKGQRLPEGTAVDGEGRPITDPEQALTGILLPFAGYKGYAISLAVELLSGVLTGAGFSKQVRSLHQNPSEQQNVGMFLAGIPVEAFLPREEYDARIAEFEEMVKGSRKAAGTQQILFPGELESEKKRRSREEGMEIDDKLLWTVREAAGYV